MNCSTCIHLTEAEMYLKLKYPFCNIRNAFLTKIKDYYYITEKRSFAFGTLLFSSAVNDKCNFFTKKRSD